jgi:hypothetical protein
VKKRKRCPKNNRNIFYGNVCSPDEVVQKITEQRANLKLTGNEIEQFEEQTRSRLADNLEVDNRLRSNHLEKVLDGKCSEEQLILQIVKTGRKYQRPKKLQDVIPVH